MDCECLPRCPFFHDRMKQMPATAEVLKQQFCRNDWASCARCRVFREFGAEAVPPDMFPDDIERAEMILEAHGVKRKPE